MIIPIGVDCQLAQFLNKHQLRSCSFPFDWTVTYNGVYESINNDFTQFTEPLINNINNYDMLFMHDFIDNTDDTEKYIRRCKRLKSVLETSREDIIFCRKGHVIRHHNEHNNKYNIIKNDIEDAEDLDIILTKKYPQLKYKIIVILICGKCFELNKIYNSKSPNIELYNISTCEMEQSACEDCFSKIFKTS